MNALHNPTLAPYAKPNGTELRITAHADTEAEALALIAPGGGTGQGALGPLRHWRRCGLPGSCLLLPLAGAGPDVGHGRVLHRRPHRQAHHGPPRFLCDLPGGIVSYTNAVKHHVLGVPQDLLDTYGAVSPQVAEAMARGAKQALGCDIALSSTGVAGPDPDDRGNPIGLVYLGIAWGDQCVVKALHAGTMATRERVRNQAAQHSLDLLRRHLTGLPLEES